MVVAAFSGLGIQLKSCNCAAPHGVGGISGPVDNVDGAVSLFQPAGQLSFCMLHQRTGEGRKRGQRFHPLAAEKINEPVHGEVYQATTLSLEADLPCFCI